jgi:hypothetical protein
MILKNLLNDVPLSMYRRMWLQIDGTPVHFGRAVRDWCDEVYPEGWMGRGSGGSWVLLLRRQT